MMPSDYVRNAVEYGILIYSLLNMSYRSKSSLAIWGQIHLSGNVISRQFWNKCLTSHIGTTTRSSRTILIDSVEFPSSRYLRKSSRHLPVVSMYWDLREAVNSGLRSVFTRTAKWPEPATSYIWLLIIIYLIIHTLIS